MSTFSISATSLVGKISIYKTFCNVELTYCLAVIVESGECHTHTRGQLFYQINMELQKPIFMYEEESQAEKLARKSKETPIFPIAITALAAAVGFGAYKFNKRGKMSPSVFLMQLRVGAQGIAVGALTLGLLYTMINEHILKKKH